MHPPDAHRARLAGAAGVLAAVLGLHALLLGGWPARPEAAPQAGPAARTVLVRWAALAAPADAAPQGGIGPRPPVGAPAASEGPAGPGAAAAAAGMHRPHPEPVPRATAGTGAPAQTAAPTTPAMPDQPTAAASAAPAADAEPGIADAPPATPATALAGITVPTYPTLLPPAFVLGYQVHRPGPQRRGGRVELAWQPEGDHYTLSLGDRVAGSTSSGTLDALGLAPDRQADTRRAREVRAVNFQRDQGRITYSGPQVQHPLLPGAQDRLSWLVQLAGVLSADPALASPGRTVQLYVTGPRGDAAVWTFTVAGPDTVDLPGGTQVAALRLLREPEGPYDTRVELWADPARHHLPVRLRLQPRLAAEATEFLLATAGPTP